MNVDLLIAADGQAALICDQGFNRGRVTAIGLNPDDLAIVVLFERREKVELNIPLEPGCAERLRQTEDMHLALVAGNAIAAVKQVPFVARMPDSPRWSPVPQSVVRFAHFLSEPLESQPVHRDHVGDESSARSLAHQIAIGKLPLSPQLEGQRGNALAAAPAPHYAPRGPKPKWIGGVAPAAAKRKARYKRRSRGGRQDRE
jgi:hypothetical protein